MSRGSKKTSVHDLARRSLTKADEPKFFEELLGGTDRSGALVGCALVDGALLAAIRSRFVPMSDEEADTLFHAQSGPLASFAARIRVGRAIGIYENKVTRYLDVIRRVRNAFAHSLAPMAFADEEVMRECILLPASNLKSEVQDKFNPSEARAKYASTCCLLEWLLIEHKNTHEGILKPIDLRD